MLLVYTDPELLDKLPEAEFNVKMRDCIRHSDDQKAQGKLLMCQQLEPVAAARTVRVRNGRAAVLDGPFAETKEMLAGFNLIEADSMEEAVRMAHELPWTAYGSIEVRPVGDFEAMRQRVSA
ncbi:MAG: YciI family protein [Vitreoscilla sp.]